jgi:hypothetical protein
VGVLEPGLAAFDVGEGIAKLDLAQRALLISVPVSTSPASYFSRMK